MNGRWTFHGGRLDEARAAYGEGPEPWLDLSTGINPHSWPDVARVSIDWQSLPEPGRLAELESAAAAHFGVDPAHLCALPGTEIGLRLLGHLLPGRAFHIVPCYRTHAEIFAASTAVPVAALAAIEAVENAAVILANPNNPDGRVIAPDILAGHLERLGASRGWLVIDEAFADVMPEVSLAARVNDDLPLVLFRSFGKFFGLPGIRLGFVAGPRPLIAGYRQRLGSWPVSSAAVAVGTAAYRGGKWIADMRRTLRAEADALDALLARHGFTALGDCPLFRLIETDDAPFLFDRLARQAILTRPFDHDPRWLRIGLPGGGEALARLDRALGHG